MYLDDSDNIACNVSVQTHLALCCRRETHSMSIMSSSADNSNESALVVYGDIELSVLQMMASIEDDEETNRKTELLQIKDDASKSVTQSSTGGVYIAYSECLGCMKIGATRRSDPLIRLREISRYTTTPFRLVAWRPSQMPFALEAFAHFHFRKQRINTRGAEAGTEFFHISAAEAAEWVDQAQDGCVSTGGKRKASVVEKGPDTKKARAANVKTSNRSFLADVTNFVEQNLVLKTAHIITTKHIQEAFIEKFPTYDEQFPERAFQKTFRGCVEAKFPDKKMVFATRMTQSSERSRGYVGLTLTKAM
jgi:hypothetical protein